MTTGALTVSLALSVAEGRLTLAQAQLLHARLALRQVPATIAECVDEIIDATAVAS